MNKGESQWEIRKENWIEQNNAQNTTSQNFQTVCASLLLMYKAKKIIYDFQWLMEIKYKYS